MFLLTTDMLVLHCLLNTQCCAGSSTERKDTLHSMICTRFQSKCQNLLELHESDNVSCFATEWQTSYYRIHNPTISLMFRSLCVCVAETFIPNQDPRDDSTKNHNAVQTKSCVAARRILVLTFQWLPLETSNCNWKLVCLPGACQCFCGRWNPDWSFPDYFCGSLLFKALHWAEDGRKPPKSQSWVLLHQFSSKGEQGWNAFLLKILESFCLRRRKLSFFWCSDTK